MKHQIFSLLSAVAFFSLISSGGCNSSQEWPSPDQNDLCIAYGEFEHGTPIAFEDPTNNENVWVSREIENVPSKELYSDIAIYLYTYELFAVSVYNRTELDGLEKPYYIFTYRVQDQPNNIDVLSLYTLYDCDGNKLSDLNSLTIEEYFHGNKPFPLAHWEAEGVPSQFNKYLW